MKHLIRILTWTLVLAMLLGMAVSAAATDIQTFSYPSGEWAGAAAGSCERSSFADDRVSFTYGGTFEGATSWYHPEGYGSYRYYNGSSVSGYFGWVTNLAYVMEASIYSGGPHYNGTDMRYTGMTLNGSPCGFGALDFADGGTFYGEFSGGTVCGRGVYVYHEPDSVTGQSVSGNNWKMVSRTYSSLGGNWYSGLTCNGYWEGFGMLCYDISYYIGEVKGQYCSGHGVYWCWDAVGDPSGSMYTVRYGHYVQGGLSYTCSHGSKFPSSYSAAKIGSSYSGGITSGGSSSSGSGSSSGSFTYDSGSSSSSSSTTPKACGMCGGSGNCHVCSGRGTNTCSGWSCDSGRCSQCDGSGKIKGFGTGKYSTCTMCSGSGRCSVCRGTGRTKCSICHGKGTCNTCHGKGTK